MSINLERDNNSLVPSFQNRSMQKQGGEAHGIYITWHGRGISDSELGGARKERLRGAHVSLSLSLTHTHTYTHTHTHTIALSLSRSRSRSRSSSLSIYLSLSLSLSLSLAMSLSLLPSLTHSLARSRAPRLPPLALALSQECTCGPLVGLRRAARAEGKYRNTSSESEKSAPFNARSTATDCCPKKGGVVQRMREAETRVPEVFRASPNRHQIASLDS